VGYLSVELASQTRAHLNASVAVTDAELYRCLSRAQSDLLWRLPDDALRPLQAIVNGTLSSARADLPADFAREQYVWYGADQIDAHRVRAADMPLLTTPLYLASETNPFYRIFYNTVETEPCLELLTGDDDDDAAYRFYYIKEPPAITEDEDPLLGQELWPPLIYFACSRVLEANGRYAESAKAQSLYMRLCTMFMARYSRTLEPYDERPGDPRWPTAT